jgi:hypothetical protein
MELATLELVKCLKSPNRRTKMIGIRALIQMEAANQRDEQHADNLKIKQALLEQRGGHVDESIPCGVVLLERPCTSIDVWQQEVESATKEEAAQSKVVGE